MQVVTQQDWQRIDAAEVERGQEVGKPREKFVDIDRMLKTADVKENPQTME